MMPRNMKRCRSCREIVPRHAAACMYCKRSFKGFNAKSPAFRIALVVLVALIYVAWKLGTGK